LFVIIDGMWGGGGGGGGGGQHNVVRKATHYALDSPGFEPQ